MAYGINTLTGITQGPSTMATLTSLNRAVVSVPANVVITGYHMNYTIGLAASGSTYGSYSAGTQGRKPTFIIGIGYVPTGGTVPAIVTDLDDVQIFDDDVPDPYMDRNTINQAGSPAYADTWVWGGRMRGRLQVGSGVGGSLYFLLGNISSVSQVTDWNTVLRATYQ